MLLIIKIILVLLHLVALPLNIIVLFLLFLYKQFVVILSKLTQDFKGPIPSASSIFRADKIRTHPHSSIVCALELNMRVSESEVSAIFQKVYDLEDRNGERCYREMGYNLVNYMGYGFWEELKDFKMSDRVHLLKPAESESTQEEETLSYIIEKMQRNPYKDGEPLWDIYLNYKLDKTLNKTMMFIRFHHVLADGMSFIKLFYALCGIHSLPGSFTKPSSSIRRWNKLTSNNQTTSILANISTYFRLITVGFIEYLDQVLISQDRNPINFDRNGENKLSGEWVCSIGKKLEVSELKMANKFHDCSILHLLLSGINRGVEQYFRKYHDDEPPPKDFHILFPVPVPGHPDLRLVNHWGLSRIQSRLGVPELSEELQELKEKVKKAGMNPLPLVSYFMFKYVVGLLPVSLANALSRAKVTSTILLSNIVGPQREMIFEEDIAVTDMFFLMPIAQESMALSAGIISYNGGIRISLTADLGCIPDKSRLDDLGGMIYEAIVESCKIMSKNREQKI